jgi:hypothetical protein
MAAEARSVLSGRGKNSAADAAAREPMFNASPSEQSSTTEGGSVALVGGSRPAGQIRISCFRARSALLFELR